MNAARLFAFPIRFSLVLRAFAGNRPGPALALLLSMAALSYLGVNQPPTPATMSAGITDEKAPAASRRAVDSHARTAPGITGGASVEPGPAGEVAALDEENDDMLSGSRATQAFEQIGNETQSNRAVTARREKSAQAGALEISGSGAETGGRSANGPTVTSVLHITNNGDRIIVSNEYHQVVSVFDAFGGENGGTIIATEDAVAEQETATAQTDYEELYPGCPRALPFGADEQMAAERLHYYGCRYRRSCSTATEEQEAVCIWHLTGKV